MRAASAPGRTIAPRRPARPRRHGPKRLAVPSPTPAVPWRSEAFTRRNHAHDPRRRPARPRPARPRCRRQVPHAEERRGEAGREAHREAGLQWVRRPGANVSPPLSWETGPPARRASSSPSTIRTRRRAPAGGTGSSTTSRRREGAPAGCGERKGGAARGGQAGADRLRRAGLRGLAPASGGKPHHYIFTVYALKPASSTSRTTRPRVDRVHDKRQRARQRHVHRDVRADEVGRSSARRGARSAWRERHAREEDEEARPRGREPRSAAAARKDPAIVDVPRGKFLAAEGTGDLGRRGVPARHRRDSTGSPGPSR